MVAATDGQVISCGKEVLPEHAKDTPVQPRYDVVYLLDDQGWHYRYSHFYSIDPAVVPGRTMRMGQVDGLISGNPRNLQAGPQEIGFFQPRSIPLSPLFHP